MYNIESEWCKALGDMTIAALQRKKKSWTSKEPSSKPYYELAI